MRTSLPGTTCARVATEGLNETTTTTSGRTCDNVGSVEECDCDGRRVKVRRLGVCVFGPREDSKWCFRGLERISALEV